MKKNKQSLLRNKILYESEDDVLNIWLSKKPIDYAEEAGGIIVHFTKDNEPVYLEILEATKFLRSINKSLPRKVQKDVTETFVSP